MIILEILKIIGIVLACIVGFVILLFLVVCFAPIRYELTAQGENIDIEASGIVKWFFGLLKAVVEYKDQKVKYYVKVAGKELFGGEFGKKEAEAVSEVIEEESKSSETKQEEPEKINQQETPEVKPEEQTEAKTEELKIPEETVSATPEAEPQEEIAAKEDATEEVPAEEGTRPEEMKQPEAESKADNQEEADSEKEKPDSKEEKAETSSKEEADETDAAEKESLKERIRKVINKIKEIKEKIQTAKNILQSKTTKRALKHIKAEIFHILNHIKPRTIAGSLEFGLDDPATTAMIYGTAAPISEMMSNGKLMIVPWFYETGISLDLVIKGRIFLGYMVLCAVRLVLDKDLRKVVKVVRRYLNG